MLFDFKKHMYLLHFAKVSKSGNGFGTLESEKIADHAQIGNTNMFLCILHRQTHLMSFSYCYEQLNYNVSYQQQNL